MVNDMLVTNVMKALTLMASGKDLAAKWVGAKSGRSPGGEGGFVQPSSESGSNLLSRCNVCVGRHCPRELGWVQWAELPTGVGSCCGDRGEPGMHPASNQVLGRPIMVSLMPL